MTYQKRNDPVIAEAHRQFLQNYRTQLFLAFENCDCYRAGTGNAAEAYTQAAKISRDAQKIEILFKSGTVYSHLENDTRAIQNFQSAIALGEKADIHKRVPDCYYRIADCYYKSKDFQKALDLYKKVTRKYPSFQETAWGLFQIGSIYKNLKQYQNAVDVFKDLIRRYPDDYWQSKFNGNWRILWESEYMTVIS